MPYADREKRLAFYRDYSRKNREYFKLKDKEYRAANRDKRAVSAASWAKRNPQKYRAEYLLRYAVSRGRIKKQPCQVCGEEKTEAHHHDYSKPYDVMWLCRKHHKELHRTYK